PSPLNGKTDCAYQAKKYGFTLGHPYEMSEPIAQGILGAKLSLEGAAPAAGPVSLVNTFPYLVPLPLGLPARLVIPIGASSGNCDGTVGVYQVENDLNTVQHMSICPPKILSNVPVCSNPLQIAATPDGATLLVTCYNNAIAFIDAASDRVVHTLS